MTLEAALIIGLALFLGPVVSNWVTARRPKDIVVSIQKTTNSASQPEIVTAQMVLPATATEDELWNAIEKGALAATSRMVTVNELILDHNERQAAANAARRPVVKDKYLSKLEKRRRKWASRKLGIPIDEVTDVHIQQLVGQTQNGQRVGVGEEGVE